MEDLGPLLMRPAVLSYSLAPSFQLRWSPILRFLRRDYGGFPLWVQHPAAGTLGAVGVNALQQGSR